VLFGRVRCSVCLSICLLEQPRQGRGTVRPSEWGAKQTPANQAVPAQRECIAPSSLPPSLRFPPSFPGLPLPCLLCQRTLFFCLPQQKLDLSAACGDRRRGNGGHSKNESTSAQARNRGQGVKPRPAARKINRHGVSESPRRRRSAASGRGGHGGRGNGCLHASVRDRTLPRRRATRWRPWRPAAGGA
jgi:hypothetical protein